MAKKVQGDSDNGHENNRKEAARAVTVARGGINNSLQLLNVITATIGDVLSGAINPVVANSAFRGSREVSKLLELQIKYGSAKNDGGNSKVLEIGR